MKKLIILFLICICYSIQLLSQDLIILKNGEEIKSKILEVSPTEIKYKKFDNLDGPTFSIFKSDVFMIKYQNGTKDVFTSEKSNSEKTNNQINESLNSNPNSIGFYLNPLGFVQFGPTLGTEITRNTRLIIDGHIRFSSLGALMYVVTANDNDGNPNSISGLGLGCGVKYLFPSRLGGLYTGASFEYGWQSHTYAEDEAWAWESEVTYVVFMGSFGYKFKFSSGFFINTGLLFGTEIGTSDKWHNLKNYKGDSSYHIEDPQMYPFGMLEVCFGIAF
jgi:hypothetical protein